MRQRSMRVLAVAGLALVAAACSSSDTTGPNGSISTTFSGIVAGDSASGNLNGAITLTVDGVSLRTTPATPISAFVMASATSYDVTGSFKPSGAAAISLTGTYDLSTGALSVSGGGFSFTGTLAGGVLSGTLTTPGGGAGSFSASSTASGTVYAFCGAAVQTGGSSQGGGATFSLALNAGTGVASGVAQGHGGGEPPVTLTGTVSGSAWTVAFTSNQDGPGTASGTFTSTSLTGSYSIPGAPESGTISASICQ